MRIEKVRKIFRTAVSLLVVVGFFSYVSSAQVAGGARGQIPGDECDDAIQAYLGANYFDSSNASPSFNGDPDESQCPGTYLAWNNSPDIWFKFTPAISGIHEFTTCDYDSYDTSMVLYWGDCSTDLLQFACNGDATPDSACQPYHSLIEYTLVANNDYFIRIGSFGGEFTGSGTLTITEPSGGGNVWYVNESNQNPGGGTSWSTAFTDLQDALDVAASGNQIWIAEGNYTPTDLGGSTDPRHASYRLLAGVEIYGGFLGNETDVDQRQPNLYQVFLTGDLNADDDQGGDNSENAYHVLIAADLWGLRAILDGVRITGGNADGSGRDEFGGGLLITDYSPGSTADVVVNQSKFVKNSANNGGAIGMYSPDAQLAVIHTIFEKNSATVRGGGIHTLGPTWVYDSLLVGNTSEIVGGTIYTNSSYLVLYNNTIVQNSSQFVGGLYIASSGNVQASNNIIWGNRDYNGAHYQIYTENGGSLVTNYNCVQPIADYSLPGSGNIDLHPKFIDEFGADGQLGTGDENFRLLQQSPCIDAADNTVVVNATDLDGNNRQVDDPYTVDTGNNPTGAPVVDMGAYEHVPGSNGVYIWTAANSSWYGDPGNWLPQGQIDGEATTLFDWSDPNVTFSQTYAVRSLVVSKGDVTFDLMGNMLTLVGLDNPLRVGSFRTDATLTFKGGANSQVVIDGLVRLDGGNITFTDETTLYSTAGMWLGNGSEISLDGVFEGNLTNESGGILPGGDDIGNMIITGDLIHKGDENWDPAPTGSLTFDISGTDPFGGYDQLEVYGTADMTGAINLRFDRDFIPDQGNSFDLINATFTNGNPPVVFCTGLPSNLACRWTTPEGLRGGDEVIVETTGPILFDAGNSPFAITGTPQDIVVADLDGVNGPDIAMTFHSLGGADGSVVILINNGMSGDTWLEFTARAPITVGVDPLDIDVGDFNGDGSANDLVVANSGGDSVSILSNDNSGIFTRTDVSIDINPKYIAIADYVEDALDLDDIVVACGSSFKASVLQNTTSLGARGTTFNHINSIAIPDPADIDPGDVDNNKDFDYVCLDGASEEVRVLEGNGNGNTPIGVVVGIPLLSGSDPVELEFANLNSDAFPDAITVNEGNGTLSVLLGNGSELGSATSHPVGSSPQSMTVFDFDIDGDDDFVVSAIGGLSGERELTVYRNDTASIVVISEGDITGSGSEPVNVEHGDFDEDGLEDIVSVIDLPPFQGSSSKAISVFFNITAVVLPCPSDVDGDGSVGVTDILAIIAAWGSDDEAADVNDDGIVDVADILAIVGDWGDC